MCHLFNSRICYISKKEITFELQEKYAKIMLWPMKNSLILIILMVLNFMYIYTHIHVYRYIYTLCYILLKID